MAAFMLLGMIATAGVLGQGTYDAPPPSYDPSPPFSYHGCSAVDISKFSAPITFPDGQLSHDSCQAACQGDKFAALFPDSCRCGNDASAVTPLDESACDNPCSDDPSSGMCGGKCPDQKPATVYVRSSHPDEAPDSITGVTTLSLTNSSPVASTQSEPSQTLTDVAPPPTLSTSTGSVPVDRELSTTVTESTSTSPGPILGNATDGNWPGSINDTDGDPSSPAQVPGSDSIQFIIPAISALSGLALVVALIV